MEKPIIPPVEKEHSQYRELQAFAQFGSDLDADTKERLEQGARIVEVLKQDRNTPIDVEKQVAIIYAVVNNLLSDINVADIKRFEEGLFENLSAVHEDVLKAISETGDLSDETEGKLKAAIADYKAKFLG